MRILICFLAMVSVALAEAPICATILEASPDDSLKSCELVGVQGDGSLWAPPPFLNPGPSEEFDITPLYDGVIPPLTYNATCSSAAFTSEAADPAGRCVPPTRPRLCESVGGCPDPGPAP